MEKTSHGPTVFRTSCELTGAKPACNSGTKPKVWIDLDNTPHVPFFKPIIRELEERGYEIVLTARDAFQVCDLAARLGLSCARIGRHYGKNKFMKVGGVGWRSMQLLPLVLRQKPA